MAVLITYVIHCRRASYPALRALRPIGSLIVRGISAHSGIIVCIYVVGSQYLGWCGAFGVL